MLAGKSRALIIILCIVGFWAWFFKAAPLAQYKSTLIEMRITIIALLDQVGMNQSLFERLPTPEVTVINNEEACHGKPPQHGKRYVFAEALQDLKQASRLFVHNAHLYPVWITLYDIRSLEAATSFYLTPGKHSEFKLPIGEYELEVQSGRTWCNVANGFDDANYIESAQLLTIKSNEVTHLQLMSYGQQPAQVMISLSHSLGIQSGGQQRIKGSGSLILQRVIGGHTPLKAQLIKSLFILWWIPVQLM